MKETNNSNIDFSSYHNRNVSMKQESIESNVSHMKTCSNSEHADNKDVLNVHDKQRTIESDNAESKAYFTFNDSHKLIVSFLRFLKMIFAITHFMRLKLQIVSLKTQNKQVNFLHGEKILPSLSLQSFGMNFGPTEKK